MNLVKIDNFTTEYDKITKLRDISKNLSLEVSLASGLAFKDKVRSMDYVIAIELLNFFDSDLLDIKLNKIHNGFYKIDILDNKLCFNKNNMFLVEDEKISIDDFLNQKLLYLANKELPKMLSGVEKEKILTICDSEDSKLINKNYNRQKLNSNDYFLTLVTGQSEKVLEILSKSNYFSITIRDYLEIIASREYLFTLDNNDEYKIKFLKQVFNNYILELGAYIAKEIERYLKDKTN